MADPHNSGNPLAAAMEWVAKITTIALEMCLPAVGGRFLDRWLNTRVFAFVGLVLGISVGFLHLLIMTGVIGKRRDDDSKPEEPEEKEKL